MSALIHRGKCSARQALKAYASEAGDGRCDSEIAAALDASPDTVDRTRQYLVEGGFDAALICKHAPDSARRPPSTASARPS